MTLGMSDDELENAIKAAARPRRIELAHATPFALGPVRVIPALRRIEGPGGAQGIEPKVMQVLIVLGEQPGTILSRDDLIERAWEGRVVGESSINRVISLLRTAIKAAAGDAVTLENVPKVGYRLVIAPGPQPHDEPAPRASPEAAAAPDASTHRDKGSRMFPVRIVAGLAAALVLAIAALIIFAPARQSPVTPVSIAMLPLRAGEGVDSLYAKGLESELRSHLARIGAMEVTTSESARLLVEEGIAPADIGARLGVDYVWNGTLTTAPDRISLTVQLLQTETGQVEWREEIFSAPDLAQNLAVRMARNLAAALGRPVVGDLAELAVSAGDYRLYLTALGLIRARGVDERSAAHEILLQVTQRNPAFADGWAGLAKAWYLKPWDQPSERENNSEEAERLAEYALTLDPGSVDALKVAGMLVEDRARGLALLKRATQLDPGDAEAWYWRAIQQRKAMLMPGEAEGSLESAKQMLAIDPLWPATWRAADAAAEFGQLDLARKMENDILAAAVTPSQRLLAQARLARYDGDLSTLFELSAKAARTQTRAERRFGVSTQVEIAKALLGMPPEITRILDYAPEYPLLLRIRTGELPALSDMAEAGFGGADYWQSEDLVAESLPLFLRGGREAELVALYDARFADHSEYLAFAKATGEEEFMIPQVSTYLAVAMQRVGRRADAAAHIAAVRAQIARWKAARTRWIGLLLMELNLAAATGDDARAIEIVRQLPDYGWPYSMSHATLDVVGLVTGNPLHEGLRQLPEVQAVLRPIEANLAKERAEVLAAGV